MEIFNIGPTAKILSHATAKDIFLFIIVYVFRYSTMVFILYKFPVKF